MKSSRQEITVSQLSQLSGVPVTTIKFYIRKNLLPKPVKTGKTRAYYTISHINRLKLIQKIRKEGDMSLDKIREIINMMDSVQQSEQDLVTGNMIDKKNIIKQAAVSLFREKGYETVTIKDIVSTSRIGRATFYKYFKNKKDLFIECIQSVLLNESSQLGLTGEGDDILVEFEKDAFTLYETNPLWRDMIRMLRNAAAGNPEEFSEKLKEVMELKIELYKKRIKKGIDQGLYRNINPRVLAVAIIGVQDYCTEYLLDDTDNEKQAIALLEEVKDLMRHGLVKNK